MQLLNFGMRLLATGAVLSGVMGVSGLSAAEWRKQSIYQVVTDRFARTDLSTTAPCDTTHQVYCGGTWRGLISKLDYIQGMGFTAVWISPVVKQIDGNSRDGSSYHGYWAKDIWALNPAFGNESDLKALSAALHARGMYLMVDIVTNHMAHMSCANCVDYGALSPFSSSSYYHPPCWINYDSQTSVEQCWQGSDTVSLPDLRTTDPNVRRIWNEWISHLVSTYSIDGLRVDSAKHVETSFWSGFNAAAGVYLTGEVYHGDALYVAPYQNYMDGVLDYPSYYYILRAFQSTSGSISALVAGLNTVKGAAKDLSLWGSFLENHDVERFASFTKDMTLAKNGIALMMLKDGIPIIYQGQEQHYAGTGTPNNREAVWYSGYSTSSELYQWITKLNQIRSHAISQDSNYLTYNAHTIYSDSRTIVLRKGYTGAQVIGVYTNAGASSSVPVTLTSSATGFTPNQALIDVMSCTPYTTDGGGGISVTLSGGASRVLYPAARLAGSGICPSLTGPSTATSTTSAPTSTPTVDPNCSSTSVDITFNHLVSTAYGDSVSVTGNVAALGNWNPSSGVSLNASQYTNSNPLWTGTVKLAPGTTIQYKFVKVGSSGAASWESDPNRSYTVPCAAASVAGSWK
ncbi:family 13 putative glycoside hydrolase [Triangularia verruculosa]|uniref:alpha-amylase n=1 Tax=Triangularia verruculosa TaxID=2587418 RepID=A0AAN6XFN0_9PEZI|nr:family 13 putative glycoside hydrolase [Triangularia verruculosa]